MLVDCRVLAGDVLELGAADEQQLCVAHAHNRGRARQAVEHRQFANNRAGSENREDTFVAVSGMHGDLEEAFLDAIAAVAGIAGEKQRLIGGEFHMRRARKQLLRQLLGQAGNHTLLAAGSRHCLSFFHVTNLTVTAYPKAEFRQTCIKRP